MDKPFNDPASKFVSKRCPNCFIYVTLDTKICPDCKTKLGGVDQFGKAKRPFNWKGYLISAILWLAFSIYIWWAFIKKE